MTETKCDHCHTGLVIKRDIFDYKTKVRGVELSVPVAHVRICDNCETVYVPARELRRWDDLLLEQDPIKSPSPQEIRQLRISLGMSVNDFAMFLRTTRQSIYSWENVKTVISPIRPIAVLLALVQASLENGSVDAISMLRPKQPQPLNRELARCRRRQGRAENHLRPTEDYRVALMLPPHCMLKKLPGLR